MKNTLRRQLGPMFVMLLLLAGGCRTTGRYFVVVGNVGTNSLDDVTIAIEGRTPLHVGEPLPGQGQHVFRAWSQPPQGEAVVSWKSPEGVSHSHTLAFEKSLSKDARYRVYFQIGRDQSLDLFVDKLKPDSTLMPWGRPASWEGTVAIPGLTSEEE